MTCSTSVEAYRKITANGLLSKQRLLVYQFLYKHGPMTASELVVKIRKATGNDPTHNSYHKRLSELEDRKVAQRIDTRVCSETGHNVVVWEVTANLPAKVRKRKRARCYACNHLRPTDKPIRPTRGLRRRGQEMWRAYKERQ